MSAFDNLFAARSYESIGSDRRFLELFSADILGAVDAASLRNMATIFRSGPGGGKTSLLRLFGPGPLGRISAGRDANREVHARLRGLGALSDSGPSVLSVYHRIDTYDALQEGEGPRGLFTLLGARLVMKWIAGLLSLGGLGHDQMDKIQVGIPRSGRTLPGSPIPCSGKALYDWAARTEEAICSAAGSLDGDNDDAARDAPSFMALDHIRIMTPGHVTVDGEAVAARPMIALDDVHRLADGQRRMLMEHVCEERYPAPVWLAERLDALCIQDFFRGINGREYRVVQLEDHWRGRGRAAFESFARSIAERRTRDAGAGLGISSLPDHLDDAIAPGLHARARDALKRVEGRVRARAARPGGGDKYGDWIAGVEGSGASDPAEALLLWKALELRIEGDEEESRGGWTGAGGTGADGGFLEAAKAAISDEFGLPYYYGFGRISMLATFNIEMFLEIASDMMDRLVAQVLLDGRNGRISAADQEEIVRGAARRRWDDMERTNRNGADARRFLESFCAFARGENGRGPRQPGVTGFELTRHLHQTELYCVFTVSVCGDSVACRW